MPFKTGFAAALTSGPRITATLLQGAIPAFRTALVSSVDGGHNVEVGKPVRTLRGIDLGVHGKVDKGAVGILESMNNGPYMPFLVRFPQGSFAFEDGELEDIEPDKKP